MENSTSSSPSTITRFDDPTPETTLFTFNFSHRPFLTPGDDETISRHETVIVCSSIRSISLAAHSGSSTSDTNCTCGVGVGGGFETGATGRVGDGAVCASATLPLSERSLRVGSRELGLNDWDIGRERENLSEIGRNRCKVLGITDVGACVNVWRNRDEVD
ncbi:hypothetical protein FA15DRAFT_436864 [Coprinopsis marcescibilis]|uniref:Uncharacterized protein n=1 Tax=Coprinopsis marcescibilis TaxID=230819 RepID=A0A5C3K8X6_COPMA|nr:hypothetical protein FA15DRAFT_436864 [Coprinopsis marcescibilis]